MKVYRLEKDNWGIWSGGCTGVTWPEDALYKQYGCTIVKAHYKEEWRFGCETLDKLIEYFGSDFARLLENGCNVVEYKVHKAHVLFSMEGIEVAFKVDKAEGKVILYGTGSDRGVSRREETQTVQGNKDINFNNLPDIMVVTGV